MKRTLTLIGLGGLLAAGIATAAPAQANCGYGGGWGNGGGYCDGPVDQFGNQYHCETVYVLGFGGTNCFWRHVDIPLP